MWNTEPLRRCAPDGTCSDHVFALVDAGQQALHVTGCPEQGQALLEHARRLHDLNMSAWADRRPGAA